MPTEWRTSSGAVFVWAALLVSCGGQTVSSDPAPTSGAARYAECKERVELPESGGECAVDDDCAPGGCNLTVCTTTAAVQEGLMTSCDVEPCAEILKECGCVSGRCQWSLKGS